MGGLGVSFGKRIKRRIYRNSFQRAIGPANLDHALIAGYKRASGRDGGKHQRQNNQHMNENAHGVQD